MKTTALKTFFIGFTLVASQALMAHQDINLDDYRNLPENYQALSACEKQDILWDKIEETEHSSLPKFAKFGLFQLMGMGVQAMTKKVERESDITPKKWKKFLHRRGSVAKVEFRPTPGHNYTGTFQGAECGLLRLSITYRPSKKRAFAPGLGLKLFRDNVPSANVSALYRLEGQEMNYNFFQNPLSNIVPIGDQLGLKLVNKIFKRVTDYPEELRVNHLADYNEKGELSSSITAPRQLFFVPVLQKFSQSKPHDVRQDFHKIPEGTKLYKVYAVKPSLNSFDYSEYKAKDITRFLKASEHIGNIVTTSRFVSSEFGDQGLFFRHEVHSKN